MSDAILDRNALLALVVRVHPDFKPVWDNYSEEDQIALAAYFLPRRSRKEWLAPTRPGLLKWYCPFACQSAFPSGHRYCLNVYTGCSHDCEYCYARSYSPGPAARKGAFEQLLARDLANLEAFHVPPAPVHLSNSTDPFQPLEMTAGHTRRALEGILAYRHRFTTVTLLTKNPLRAVEAGYVKLFQELNRFPAHHPWRDQFAALELPAFQVHVSLAFWREEAGSAYDVAAPTLEDRKKGIRALRQAGIPLVLRIDPLFPREPLPLQPRRTFADFGLLEPQTLTDLEQLVDFGRRMGVRHIVYSAAKIVHLRGRTLSPTMAALRTLYQSLSVPDKPVWRGGSWRLPREICNSHVVQPFLEICRRRGLRAKFCMQDLLETP